MPPTTCVMEDSWLPILICVLILFFVIPTTIGYGIGRSRSEWRRDEDRLAFIAGCLGYILWTVVGTWLYWQFDVEGFVFSAVAVMAAPVFAFAFGSISVHTARLFFRLKR